MYDAVPTISPALVIRRRSTLNASPKSPSFATPSSVRKTLAGFRSRWMTPRACAYSSACVMPSAILSVASTSSRRPGAFAGRAARRARGRRAARAPRPPPRHELADDVGVAVLLADVVDGDDVRVVAEAR